MIRHATIWHSDIIQTYIKQQAFPLFEWCTVWADSFIYVQCAHYTLVPYYAGVPAVHLVHHVGGGASGRSASALLHRDPEHWRH